MLTTTAGLGVQNDQKLGDLLDIFNKDEANAYASLQNVSSALAKK